MKSSNKPPFLFDWISDEELHELKIPLHYKPIITASLPEVAHFSDPATLKKLYSEKAVSHLYKNLTIKKNVNIVIFTWVIGDGLGDFSAQIETAKTLLASNLSSANITLISLHPTSMPLSPSNLGCPHFFIPYEEKTAGDWNSIPPVFFSKKILSLLQSAHVILQIPTYFPHTKALLSKIFHKKKPSYELIGEGGWGHTPQFSPSLGSRSLGLHSWEAGLFFPRTKENFTTFNDICNPFLKSALSKNNKNTDLYLGYMRTKISCKLFLQAILHMTRFEKKDLCFCAFPSESLIQELPSLTKELQEKGIKQIEIFYEKNYSRLPIQAQGKTLTIIQTKKISRSDYQILLQLANSPVGCRGDGSFSETITAKKIPFFDFPVHKKPVLEGLLALANHYVGFCSLFFQYLQEFSQENPNPYKIGEYLADQRLQKEFLFLSSLLLQKHNVETFIQNLTLRSVSHHFYPEIAALEKTLLNPFLNGEKTAFQSLKEIKSLIETTRFG